MRNGNFYRLILDIKMWAKTILQIGAFLLISCLWWIFLNTVSYLNNEQIAIVIWIFLVTSFFFIQRYRISYIVVPLGTISIAWILLLWIIPLYYEEPKEQDFIQIRSTQFIVMDENKSSEVKIETDTTTKIIPIKQSIQKIYSPESNKTTFSFLSPANKENRQSVFLIQFPDKTTLALYPWSNITLIKEGQNEQIEKPQWNIEYILGYTPDIIEKNQSQMTQKNENDFIGKPLLKEYQKDEKTFFINKAGGEIMMQPTIHKRSNILLDIAYFIRPKIYEKNKQNYEKFKTFLSWEDNQSNTYKQNKNIQKDIINSFLKGIWESTSREK